MNIVLDILQSIVSIFYYCIRAIVVTFVPVSWRAKNISGQTCLVTGSASGIGRQMAKKFSSHKCRMVLVDINKELLEQAAEECRKAGAVSVNTYTCDLSDRLMVYDMAEKVKGEVGPVDILVNNAGIVSGKAFLELDDDVHIDRTMKINTICHFWLVKSFLPDMLRRQKGHIMTVSSMAGISAPLSHMVDYATSKFAAIGFAETLDFELRVHYKTNAIKQTIVCPYFISTGMFQGITLQSQSILPYMTVEYVASKAVDGLLTDTPIVMLPPWLRLIASVKYAMPMGVHHLLADLLGTTGTMSTFVGRKKE